MASGRKQDKKYGSLVRENNRLQQDVESLEDAYFLHKRIREEEESSVRGTIRKEIGGSIWQYGGSGKLRTYKNQQDLDDQYGLQPNRKSGGRSKGKTKTGAKRGGTVPEQEGEDATLRYKTQNLFSDQGKTDNELEAESFVDDQDKISALKTKVLQKAGSKVINRDNWSRSSTSNKPTQKTFPQGLDAAKQDVHQKDRNKGNMAIGRKDSGSDPKKRKSKMDSVDKRKELQEKRTGFGNSAKYLSNKQRAGADPLHTVSTRTQQRAAGSSSDDENNFQEELMSVKNVYGLDPSHKFMGYYTLHEDSDQNKRKKYRVESKLNHVSTELNDRGQNSSHVREYDPKDMLSSQAREPAFPNTTTEPVKSLVLSNTAEPVTNSVVNSTTETVPEPCPVKCDAEVEHWLRQLGLVDVEKYIQIFAEQEIDMFELKLLTGEQLHKMGVTAVGTFNKILRGINELKASLLRSIDRDQEDLRVAASNDSEHSVGSTLNVDSTSLPDFVASINSCQENGRRSAKPKTDLKEESGIKNEVNEASPAVNDPHENVSGMLDLFVDDIRASKDYEQQLKLKLEEEDSDSIMDGVIQDLNPKQSAFMTETPVESNTNRSARARRRANNTQTKTKEVYQNTSVKASTFIIEEPFDKRKALPRTNNSTKTKVAADKRPPSTKQKARGQVQTRTKGSEKVVKSKSLLRPRSSSVTRMKEKGEKTVQDQNTGVDAENGSRQRSRSVEAVQRKALEGVQAAAKRFEEKQQRMKELELQRQMDREKKKVWRDALASRHIQRDRERETTPDGRMEVEAGPTNDGFDNLITVNILSKQAEIGEDKPVQKDSCRGSSPKWAPDTTGDHRSRRRMRQSRQDGRLDLHDLETPLLSTYKITPAEPRQNMDTGTDLVADLQSRIKTLQQTTVPGDRSALNVIHDLQSQLQAIEQQIKQKGTSPSPAGRQAGAQTEGEGPQLAESLTKAAVNESKPGPASMSMSKRELLTEMRKEKDQHRKQIRHLQSELKRIRHSDPVWNMEMKPTDIDYQEPDLIGEGTFSRVYRGTYQGSEVAIKCLKIPLQVQDRNYFAAEVSLLKELRHPRVVLLIGVCTSDRYPQMVLEYMSGGSLFMHLHNQDREPLDHAEYYQIARDMALGMNYLHNHNPEVLHLDLKSMNVLLCENLRAKIADFGFSKLRHEADKTVDQKSKTKQTRGSPVWMAPELLDKGEITPKADVYSFGIILWEMLTRKIPYEGSSIFQILELVRKKKRPEIPQSCPKGLEQIMKLCWDANPARRPPFKDVILHLENMAFPPAWRALFQEAGVPREALEDVQSTRTIISFVTNTLDSEALHSFMYNKECQGSSSADDRNVVPSSERSQKSGTSRSNSARLDSDRSHSTRSNTERSESARSEQRYSKTDLKLDYVRSSEESSSGDSSSEESSDSSTLDYSSGDSLETPTSRRKGYLRKPKLDDVPSLRLSGLSTVSHDPHTSQRTYLVDTEETTAKASHSSKNPKKHSLSTYELKSPQVSQSLEKPVQEGRAISVVVNSSQEVASLDFPNKPIEGRSPRKKKSFVKKISNKTSKSLDVASRNTVSSSKYGETSFDSSQFNTRPAVHAGHSNMSLDSFHGLSINQEMLQGDMNDNLRRSVLQNESLKSLELALPALFPEPSAKNDAPCDNVENKMENRKPPKPTPRTSKTPRENTETSSESLSASSKEMELKRSQEKSDSIRASGMQSTCTGLKTKTSGLFGDNKTGSFKDGQATSSTQSSESSYLVGSTASGNNSTRDLFSEGHDEYSGILKDSLELDTKPQGQQSVQKMKELQWDLSFEVEDDTDEIDAAGLTESHSGHNLDLMSRDSLEAWGENTVLPNKHSEGDVYIPQPIRSGIPSPPQVLPQTFKPTSLADSVPPVAPPLPDLSVCLSRASVTKSSTKGKVSKSSILTSDTGKVTGGGLSKGSGAKSSPPMQPQQSSGTPQFMVQSLELQEKRGLLKSVSKAHPNQLEDLSRVSKEKLSSIAEILRKAVKERRIAMGEEGGSAAQSVDTEVTWSLQSS